MNATPLRKIHRLSPAQPTAALAALRRLRLPLRLPLRAADLRGLSRLGVQAVLGVTDIVETMHHTVASRPGPLGQGPTGRPGGITGFVYGAVRGTTRVVGRGLDAAWAALPLDTRHSTPEREALLAALNGVFGDQLADTGNPLAIPMQWRFGGRPWDAVTPTLAAPPGGRILVLVHGLAMNDLQWSRQGHDHGQALARDLGYTPVYLHYNSGRHVSQNGRDLADRLDDLLADWPVPVEELVILAHSMGGLVTRSACSVAAGRPWLRRLTRLVFLGTPHHGAPLERGGRRVDALLGLSPYAAPLARLGKARSAGITDLRYGNLQDADWQHRDRHDQTRDDRQPTPLPAGVKAYAVAATTSPRTDRRGGLRDALVGDGLVPVASALGEHRDPALDLRLPAEQRLLIAGANHWDLLNRANVYAALRDWLA